MGREVVQAALLDRDGTINVKAAEGEYITSPDALTLLPGAGAAIGALNRAEIPVVVVTNQRGIALGRMSEADLAAVHRRLQTLLAAHDAWIDAFFHCPHDRDACRCRKPQTGLLRRAQAHLDLPALNRSVMIGDSIGDVVAGLRIGARSVLIGDDTASVPAGVAVAPSLADAVTDLLAGTCSGGVAGRLAATGGQRA